MKKVQGGREDKRGAGMGEWGECGESRGGEGMVWQGRGRWRWKGFPSPSSYTIQAPGACFPPRYTIDSCHAT